MDIKKEREAFESLYKPCDRIAFCFGLKKYTQLSNEDNDSEIVDHANQCWELWQAAKAQAVPECKWSKNQDGFYDTSCTNAFVFPEPEDRPIDHDFTHCCFCGGQLIEPQEST